MASCWQTGARCWRAPRPLALALVVAAGCHPATDRVELIELQVSNVQRAVRFYHAVFGWDASYPDSSYGLLAAGSIAIGLASADSVEPGGPLIVIAVADLELVRDRVVQQGGVLRQPIAPSWRGRQFRFADLDGHELVVWSNRDRQQQKGTR